MAELELAKIIEKMSDFDASIEADEAEYSKKIEAVARRITDNGNIRVLLLAGPSGSGKTTTANLIADKIEELGEMSMVVSLDNFYRDADDPKYPRLPDGERDFESPYALNTDVLIDTLGKIIRGESFTVPRYDFKVGAKVSETEYGSFSHGCVIIEGIHGLNPMLSDPFPKESVLKLFVSVSTNINDDGERILSGRKLRFVRRMVRDSIYRAADAKRTIGMWENVLHGEDMYLYPYKELADMHFDTFHTFEPSVLKPFAVKLLTDDVREFSDYANIVALALERIPERDYNKVPQTSLIREFVPGGIYEDLY